MTDTNDLWEIKRLNQRSIFETLSEEDYLKVVSMTFDCEANPPFLAIASIENRETASLWLTPKYPEDVLILGREKRILFNGKKCNDGTFYNLGWPSSKIHDRLQMPRMSAVRVHSVKTKASNVSIVRLQGIE